MPRLHDRPLLESVEVTLNQAAKALVEQQKEDGSWSGFCPGGPFSTCMTMVTEGHLGVLSQRDAEQGVTFLRSQQRADGSFEDYPFAKHGSLDATATAIAAMVAAEVSANDPMRSKADAYVAQQGGHEACIAQTQILLALVGEFDAKKLAKPFLAFRLVPGVDGMATKRIAVFPWVIFNAFAVITAGLRQGNADPAPWWRPVKNFLQARFRSYFTRIQCPDGNWNGVIYNTLLGILTLHFLGVPTDDPRMAKALAKIQQWKQYSAQGLEVIPFGADIWNTSVAVRALLLHGMPVTAEPVERGIKYLLAKQPDIPGPKHWQNAPPGVPLVGGWPFQPSNPFSPDLDSTGDVVWTLALATERGAGKEIQAGAERALRWLVPMQNKGGGWAGYCHGQADKPAGPIFTKPMVEPTTLWGRLRMTFNPPPEMLDCANADITGRVLCSLKAHGYSPDHPAIKGGVRFLRDQQWTNDLWWGRWQVNYLFGSAYALSGLAAAGISAQEKEVSRCIKAILEHQNSDGGWGETIDSYLDPSLAGEGPSSAALTGRVLAALVETGESSLSTLNQAAEYLVTQQNDHGHWVDDQTMWVVIPPAMYYINPVYTQYLAMEGLIRYRDSARPNSTNKESTNSAA